MQLSSISKFGLLELSRQRLRPALRRAATSPARAATAPATSATPRAPALQILRIIRRVDEGQHRRRARAGAGGGDLVPAQREAQEITKIELKQRITVLLVPNKHPGTPNYRLERLRHDDPRLENLQASYR